MPAFTWSDNCPDRGWLSLATHPDTRASRVAEYGRDGWAEEHRCCGWYMSYPATNPERPIMAAVYVRRIHPLTGILHETTPPTGKIQWFPDIPTARAWMLDAAASLVDAWRWKGDDLIPTTMET